MIDEHTSELLDKLEELVIGKLTGDDDTVDETNIIMLGLVSAIRHSCGWSAKKARRLNTHLTNKGE